MLCAMRRYAKFLSSLMYVFSLVAFKERIHRTRMRVCLYFIEKLSTANSSNAAANEILNSINQLLGIPFAFGIYDV